MSQQRVRAPSICRHNRYALDAWVQGLKVGNRSSIKQTRAIKSYLVLVCFSIWCQQLQHGMSLKYTNGGVV